MNLSVTYHIFIWLVVWRMASVQLMTTAFHAFPFGIFTMWHAELYHYRSILIWQIIEICSVFRRYSLVVEQFARIWREVYKKFTENDWFLIICFFSSRQAFFAHLNCKHRLFHPNVNHKKGVVSFLENMPSLRESLIQNLWLSNDSND